MCQSALYRLAIWYIYQKILIQKNVPIKILKPSTQSHIRYHMISSGNLSNWFDIQIYTNCMRALCCHAYWLVGPFVWTSFCMCMPLPRHIWRSNFKSCAYNWHAMLHAPVLMPECLWAKSTATCSSAHLRQKRRHTCAVNIKHRHSQQGDTLEYICRHTVTEGIWALRTMTQDFHPKSRHGRRRWEEHQQCTFMYMVWVGMMGVLQTTAELMLKDD